MVKKKTSKEARFEIEFYEGVLTKKPDFTEALAALGDLYTQEGFYQKGLEVDEKLVQLKPEDPVVNYNLACSYSLLHDVDKAFRSIKRAVNCGYKDFSHLEKDRDLNNLREDERFTRYFSRIKKKRDKDRPYGNAQG